MADSLVGIFEYQSNEKLTDFYKTWHLPDEVLEKIMPKAGSRREIKVDGNKITLVDNEKPTTLILDTEVDESDANKYALKSTAKLEGKTLKVTSKSVQHPEVVLHRTYSVSEKGLTITLGANNVDIEAKIHFSRV